MSAHKQFGERRARNNNLIIRHTLMYILRMCGTMQWALATFTKKEAFQKKWEKDFKFSTKCQYKKFWKTIIIEK